MTVAFALAQAPTAPQQMTSSIDLDFANGVYRIGGAGYGSFLGMPGATFSRASACLAYDAVGALQYFASGAPAITSAGLSSWGASTNKCTNYNAVPQALVAMTDLATFNASVTNIVAGGGDAATLYGVVDDTAQMAASVALATQLTAGRLNGRALKIDNSAGAVAATLSVSGATGNTNPHPPTGYCRGTGNGRVRLTGASAAMVALSATYQRLDPGALTPGAITDVWVFEVDAGGVGYVILNQLEERAFASTPIIVAGSAATRAADVTTLPFVARTPFSLSADYTVAGLSGTQRVAQVDDGTVNNQAGIYVAGGSAGSVRGLATTGGVSQFDTSVGGSSVANVQTRAAFRFQSFNARGAVAGALGTLVTNGQLPVSFSTLHVGVSPLSVQQVSGTIARVRLVPAALSDSQIISLSA